MSLSNRTESAPRTPLTRERVLMAGVNFADQKGIVALSMRKLGEVLGVEAMSLYDHLEKLILPLYTKDTGQWRRIMRSTIALNGSFFNTQRMLEQYVLNAYFPERPAEKIPESKSPQPDLENSVAH